MSLHNHYDNIISVIVPIYNTELYLNRCIQSILFQDYTNIQLILVNDGSTDNSGIICDNYASKDKRITTIHKQNGGVSSARNAGLAIATGYWIMFVDSDDYIEENMISNFLAHASKEFDLIISGISIIYKGEISLYPMRVYKYSPKTLLEDLQVGYDTVCLSSPVCKFYKRSIIEEHNIRFDLKISMGEDMLFILDYLKYCKNIQGIKGNFYNYIRIREDSLMTAFNEKYFTYREYVYKKIITTAENFGCIDDTINRLNILYVTVLFYTIVESYKKSTDKIIIHNQINVFLNNSKVKQTLKLNNRRFLFKILKFFVKFKANLLMQFSLYIKFKLFNSFFKIR